MRHMGEDITLSLVSVVCWLGLFVLILLQGQEILMFHLEMMPITPNETIEKREHPLSSRSLCSLLLSMLDWLLSLGRQLLLYQHP